MLSLQDQIQSSIVSSGCIYTPWLKRKIKEINLVALPSDAKTMFWPRSNQKVAPGAKSLAFWYRCSLQVWKMQCSGREYLALGTEKSRCPRSADWHLQFDLAHIQLWPEEICNMDLPKHKQPSCIKLTWCNLTGQCLFYTLLSGRFGLRNLVTSGGRFWLESHWWLRCLWYNSIVICI